MRQRRAHVRATRDGRGGVTLLVGATTVVVVVSAILAVTIRREPPSPNRRLAEAVGAHRVTRGRLTGGFAYAPCDTVTPNDSLISGLLCERTRPSQWPEAGALSKLAPDIRASSAGDSSGARGLHAIGAWHVVWGDLDAAIDELRAAASSSATDAWIQSDLAVALIANAQRTQDPRSLLEAYVAVDSALALDSMQVEARFNRAVVLDALQLRTDAIAGWLAYLEVDGSSRWAEEARNRLRALRALPPDWKTAGGVLRQAVVVANDSVVRSVARSYPARVREVARRAILAWANAEQARAPRADSLLNDALTLSRALAATTGDSLWADAMASLIEPTDGSGGDRTDAVARGILALDRGDAFLGRLSLDSAERSYRESQQLLRASRSAMAYSATYGLAAVAYSRQSPASYLDALATLRDIRATAPESYRIVRGLAARTEGVIRGVGADFGGAIAAYTAATEDGRGTGDPGLEIRPHANLAGNYANLGDERAAWGHVYQALRAMSRFLEANRDLQRIFMRAADLSASRSPQLALLFQREAIALASRTNPSAADSMVMIAALRREAELLGRQGLTDPALESVRKGRAYIATIQTDSVRAVSGADMDLVEAQALLADRPDSAARVLERVVERFRDTQYYRQFARAELLLANAYAATGAMDPAQRSFESALSEVERRRSIIVGPEERARFLDQARPVIDTLVSIYADRGNPLKALEFVEQVRGRVLLERVRDGSKTPAAPEVSIAAVRRSLMPGTTVVSFAIVKGEVVAWVIRPDGVSMHRTPAGPNLANLTSRFASGVAGRSSAEENRAVASELYRILVAPVAGKLERTRRLVIIPDKWLHFVPFAALFDPVAGQFLIERFEINVAPSLQLFVESAARYEKLRQSPSRTVLTVGNPSFDGRVFSLPPLPGAEREAQNIASLYQRPAVLVGPEATRAAFLSAAPAANVIHFAGHGVVRSDAPLLSYLLFADAEGDNTSGALTAQDLFVQRLPNTRLAILSGCQTASGQLSATEGTSSLARAFFAAGVPAVVASLWAVDDQATASFFIDYHRALVAGADPSAALRRVQLAWLRDKNGWSNASTWAAFTLFGTTGRSPDEKDAEYGVSRSSLQ
jgi:CHAT domain-containing protein